MNTEPLVTFTMFPDTGAQVKREFADMPWAELVQRIREPQTYTSKSECPLISCADYGDRRSPKNALRHADNVRRIFAVEGDYDGEQMSIDDAAALLQGASIKAVLYTSPSHRPEAPRWRVIAPLGDPEISEKRREFVGRLNRVLGGVLTIESFSLSQSYYIGRVLGREYRTLTTEGRTVDLATEIEPLYYDGHTAPGERLNVVATIDSIKAGNELHPSVARYAMSLSARGLPAEEIRAILVPMIEQCERDEKRRRHMLNGELTDIITSAIAKRGKASAEKTAATWQPPVATAYGASFDAANIPRRRWLVGNRYAIGEVTAIAGPPGTNKSTMMLVDAVAITTGRQLLNDPVHRVGEVLFLVGEDARRDFEARLAAILVHYNIQPAELGNRLHVVYLAEVDPLVYTLANMIADMAVLNRQMFEWLRDFPEIVATFVDPMLAWHRLVENDNVAMQVLCSGLRALAVQGDMVVAFDHHVTKLSMTDVEAHVGNLASLRGGSSIAADARWAFTLAKLKRETAEEFGVPEEMRSRYRRLDPLKASYGPDDGDPRLLKIESVQIANGETVGVLVEVNMDDARAAAEVRQAEQAQEKRTTLATALTKMLAERCPRSANEAAAWFAAREPLLFTDKKGEPLSERTIRRKLPAVIGTGIDVHIHGKPNRIVVIETGTGTGTRVSVALAQESMP